MQPWRETKLPWLINGREGCLMNSMTYLNKSHLQSIHKVKRLALRQRKPKQVFQFTINAQGRLSLEKIPLPEEADGAHQDKPTNLNQPAQASD